ncbi:hypothetical protein B0H16DRAFT_1742038 [Mycena metata]|uniref:Uncharacterized protein n=1 Tax=Mycena metata TaxID=1033252 RepID=A0AAD7MG44_9AGAR|nr:hypothetical protein B0H16DRAFT_1742038 [Mycena metata]
MSQSAHFLQKSSSSRIRCVVDLELSRYMSASSPIPLIFGPPTIFTVYNPWLPCLGQSHALRNLPTTLSRSVRHDTAAALLAISANSFGVDSFNAISVRLAYVSRLPPLALTYDFSALKHPQGVMSCFRDRVSRASSRVSAAILLVAASPTKQSPLIRPTSGCCEKRYALVAAYSSRTKR